MKEKIKDKSGFSISEMLMVVMILALIIVVLGSGVMVVKNAYEKITLKAEAQTLLSTTIAKVSDEFRYSRYIDDDETPVKFASGNLGYKIWFENGHGADGKKGILVCNGTGTSVQLLTDKTMTDGLTPSITYGYDKDKNLFCGTITITGRDNEKFLEQEIKVEPIN